MGIAALCSPSRPVQLILTVFLAAVAAIAPTAGADEQPNFVFIITDDISAGDLPVYGNERLEMPRLSKLAEDGLVFDNAYLTTSSCSPSRNSIITGRYPHNTGAPEIHVELPADQHTFVQDLDRAGYHTVLSGKNHMAPPGRLGFDEASTSRPAGSENWLRHLRERPDDQPFFFWFASYDAHRKWQANDKAPTYDPGRVWVPPYLYDGPRTREDLTGYYHEVRRSDHYLGLLLDELERQGIRDNTYVIYCSDNGRPFPRSKTYLYESGIRTPLVIAGPGVEAGRSDAIVSSIDFAATFLDLAGVEKPNTVQGVSLAPVLRDPAGTVRDVAFAERNWHRYRLHERMVRWGDWLYIRNSYTESRNLCGESDPHRFPAAQELWAMHEEGKLSPAQALITKVPQPAEQLFNVEADPHQLDNLAGEPERSAQLKRARRLLARWIERTGDSVPEDPTPNKAGLYGKLNEDWYRGEMPGKANDAAGINHPGPIRLDGDGSSGG